MSGTNTQNWTVLGTLDAAALINALDAVSFAAAPPSEEEPNSLTGTMLYVTNGFTLVAATDHQHLARERMVTPGISSDGVVMLVPHGFRDTLVNAGVSNSEIELAISDDNYSLSVLDISSDFEFVQPLWNHTQVLTSFHELTKSTRTDYAVVPIGVFDPLMDTTTTFDAPLIVAVTPKSIILRDQFQMLGSPVEAMVFGDPVQVEVGAGFIPGARFIQDRSLHEYSHLAIEVYEEEGFLVFESTSQSDSEGKRNYSEVIYASRFNSRLADPSTIDRTALAPDAAYYHVPEANEPELDADQILAKITAITGQQAVKAEVQRLVAQADMLKRREAVGLKGAPLAMNFVFSGPPGTGKTTVARLLAELMSALGVLPTSKLVEVDRSALVASHIGGTEEKTLAAIESAMGGVLFIDEAYALAGAGGNDFGKQAIETLLKAIEDRRGEFACIVAGYTKEMATFLDSNPGMKSRFTQFINFEPYSAAELLEIGTSMVQAGDNVLDAEAHALLRQRLAEEEMRGGFENADWGNARSMRNIVGTAEAQRDLRISGAGTFDHESMSSITAADISVACGIHRIGSSVSTGESSEDVLAELDKKVGQPALKQQIEVLVSSAKIAQMKAEHGLGPSTPDLPHLLFMGPSGTGKTTIARLLARLYKSLGLLSSGHVVEVDQSDLVSSNVGGTAEKTTQMIDEALGGVLFIDEAYTLAHDNKFGTEAINTLLKRMSDDQGKFLVIAAGYTGAMQDFLKSNDGLSRRFATKIEFETYTADELAQIAISMLEDRGEVLDDDAEQMLRVRLAAAERAGVFEGSVWGNAGSMGNLIGHSARLRNQRLTRDLTVMPSPDELVTITAADLEPACDSLFGVADSSEESLENVLAELDKQVGQQQLKQQIQMLITGAKAEKLRAEQGFGSARPDLPHLMFMGPSGTGKTTIARLIARLYKALGLLPSGHVVEVDQSKLVAGYVGQTSIKTAAKVDEAMGGVLFIDEAYTLAQGSKSDNNSFGSEAVATLLKRMSDDSGKFLVIAAGYTGAMQDFLKMNDGLARRFPTKIEFEAYTAVELVQIAQIMVKDKGETLEVEAARMLEDRLVAAERAGVFEAEDWGNAGSVGNLVSQASRLRNLRLFSDPSYQPSGDDLMTITAADIAAASDVVLGSTPADSQESIEDVLTELESQIGQPALKRQVSGLMAGVRAQQARAAAGLGTGGSLVEHLIFTGPPGTGKTTVARLLARLYKALGVLPGGQVIEVDRAGLVAGYVGQTAIKTEEQIAKAMGGVLFIDEAYTLVGDDFGTEAIDTLLARMENDRGKFMVISAGYPEQMAGFLKSNPGLPSRFTQTIDFHAYTATELAKIATNMVKGKGESITDDAFSLLVDRLVAAELQGTFGSREWGNARAVRNVIDKAAKARDSRLYSDPTATPDLNEMALITLADMEQACDSDGLTAMAGIGQQVTQGGYSVEPSALPVADDVPRDAERPRWRNYESDAERESVRAGIKTLVGRAAQKLAPGVMPGKAAPVGPELAELGFAEIYWQGGSSMGIQIRFKAYSKDRMHYFAGGSNGNLPDVAGYRGQKVLEENQRDTVDTYPLHTLEEWQASGLDLAEFILESIRNDLAANPE